MSTEDHIQALLAVAAPLREFEPDDPRAAELPGLVDQINRLRVRQQQEHIAQSLAVKPIALAVQDVVEAEERLEDAIVKRGPGRPRKAE